MDQPTREIDINQLVDDLACPGLAPGLLARSLNLTEPQFADIVTSAPVREAMDAVRRIEEARADMLQARLRTLVLQRLQMLSYHDPIEATEIAPEIDARRRETARKATALLAALVYPECHHMPEGKAHGPTKPEGMTLPQISAATDALEAEHNGEGSVPTASPSPSTPTKPTTHPRFTIPMAPCFPTAPRARINVHTYTLDPNAAPNENQAYDRSEQFAEKIIDPPLKTGSPPVEHTPIQCTVQSEQPRVPDPPVSDPDNHTDSNETPHARVPGPAKSARENQTDSIDPPQAQQTNGHENGHTNGYHQLE